MSTQEIPTEFNDNDFVYVDVQAKKVIGKVTWDKHGNAEKLEQKIEALQPEQEGKLHKPRRPRSARYYPWCRYATAKKIYQIEGKFSEKEDYEPFDTVLSKALEKPYWSKGSSTTPPEPEQQ